MGQAGEAAGSDMAERGGAIMENMNDTICKLCGRRRGEHKAMTLHCPKKLFYDYFEKTQAFQAAETRLGVRRRVDRETKH